MVDAALEEQKLRSDAEAAAGEASENDAPPVWRKLRAQAWRQTGAWLPEIETRFAGPRDELVAYVAREVGASLVQQRERIYDLADGLIGALVEQHCPSNQHVDDWDFDALKEAIQDQFAVDVKLKKKVADATEMAEQIWKSVDKRLAERLEELSRPWLMYFSRHFYLEEIDHQWIDHLKTMEHLREGIYLRGYGQKDPKKEYKKEGFDLFSQMMHTIQVNTARKLFRVQIQRPEAELPAMQAKQRKLVMQHPSAEQAAAGQESSAQAAEPAGS
jgi:preprotein translocase subunit SecA